jgi:uncharacterized protein YbjQ (UPF0145 family)
MSTAIQPPLARGVSHSMVTTAFDIGGYKVVRITLLTNLCEKTRNDAFELMIQHANEVGANAIIGARYDATEVMQGVTEVLAYGTAVVLAPKSE